MMQRESTPVPSNLFSDAVVSVLALAVAAAVGYGCDDAAVVDEDTRTSEQDATDVTRDPQPDVVADALVRALDEQLTVWKKPDGGRIHIAHCRRAEGGCRARIEAFAKLLVEAARKYDVDPFLLAAMAIRESGLRPGAVGVRGSGGILQLNPRGVGYDVRIVRDAHYRRHCRSKPAACQGPVIELGAQHLAEWIDRCDSLRKALGGYNSGKCRINRYPGKVLNMREKLETYAYRAIVESDQSG